MKQGIAVIRLFVICCLYYSYVKGATPWVVPPILKLYILQHLELREKKIKITPRHNFCIENLRRNDLENNTQGITFKPDVGIKI